MKRMLELVRKRPRFGYWRIAWLLSAEGWRAGPASRCPEFIAVAIRRWLSQVDGVVLYIEPGSPWENGDAEGFHGRVGDEFLAVEVLENLTSARALTVAWKEDYNHHRSHGSLGYQFAAACAASAPAAPAKTRRSHVTRSPTDPLITRGPKNRGRSLSAGTSIWPHDVQLFGAKPDRRIERQSCLVVDEQFQRLCQPDVRQFIAWYARNAKLVPCQSQRWSKFRPDD